MGEKVKFVVSFVGIFDICLILEVIFIFIKLWNSQRNCSRKIIRYSEEYNWLYLWKLQRRKTQNTMLYSWNAMSAVEVYETRRWKMW